MKFIFSIILFALSIFPTFAQSITHFDSDGVRVEVLELREQNDSLRIVFSVDIQPYTVARYQGLNITLGVETADSLMLLPTITVVGENKRRVLRRHYHNSRQEQRIFNIDWRSPYSYIYTVTMPYQMWMDEARLSVRQEIQGYQAVTNYSHFLLGTKVELGTRLPYEVQVQTALLTPPYVEKVLMRRGQAFLDFPVNQTTILPNFRRNPEELRKIDEAISRVTSDPDVIIQNLFIEGFASPEGSWESNDRLARGRANALKDYIRTRFNIPEWQFTVNSVAEDWDGLVAMVKESSLPNRDQVLHIIETVGIFNGRETQLMNLSGGNPWRIMLRDMFPDLRRVEYQINYTVRDYSLQDALVVIERNPGNLSLLEMFQVAETFGRGTPRFNEILTDVILRYFGDDETANLNAAAVMIDNRELTTAKRLLERAGNSPAALNNRGVVALLVGNLDEADSYFARAQQAGNTEAIRNRAEVAAKREDNIRMERFRNR